MIEMNHLKAALKRAFAHLNVSVSSATLAKSINAQRIGATGAASAFSYYIKNQANLSSDRELSLFMSFYADKWSLSYSQWSQDIFVMYALKSLERGTFLEIGGADGITHSNSLSLETNLNWSGMLIEPDPQQYLDLIKARPNATLLNAAISIDGSNGTHRLRRVGQLSALEGLEGKDHHHSTRMQSSSFYRVKTMALTEILKKQCFDYFSLDVEGAELPILQSIDFNAISKPTVMTVEHNCRPDDMSAIRNILLNAGYEEYFAEHDWLRGGDIWVVLRDQ